jgi:hypothetical protein
MIIGELMSVYPLMNQLSLLISIVVEQLKVYLEAMNG